MDLGDMEQLDQENIVCYLLVMYCFVLMLFLIVYVNVNVLFFYVL